jgi:hypothetical protein
VGEGGGERGKGREEGWEVSSSSVSFGWLGRVLQFACFAFLRVCAFTLTLIGLR